MRTAAIAVMLMLVFGARPAAADAVDQDIKQLQSNAITKNRLLASARLVRGHDPRAIAALVDALLHDSEETIRRHAALGLGKIVTDTSSPADLQLAIGALGTARKHDRDRGVRRNAKKVYARLLQLTAPAGTYVDLGTMSSPQAGMAAHMRTSVDTLVNQQPSLQTASPASGFHLEITASLTQSQGTGASMLVACKVQIVLADYPGLLTLANISGGAKTSSATGGASALASAATDCVDAVLDDMLIKKVFPQITKLAAQAAVAQSSTTSSSSSSSSSSTSTTTTTP